MISCEGIQSVRQPMLTQWVWVSSWARLILLRSLAVRPSGWLGLVWLAVLPGVRGAPAITSAPRASAVRVEAVIVDGQERLIPDGVTDRLRLASGSHHLDFRFAPLPEAAERPLRLRYQLEGLDSGWREAGGEMRVSILLLNAASDVVAFLDFPMRGTSEGWSGDPERSRFTRRRENVQVPEGASRLRIMFVSGGWQNTLGVAALGDFQVLAPNAAGTMINLCTNSALEEGMQMNHPGGQPYGWLRGGFGATMAKVLQTRYPAPGHALIVEDDNIRSYCEWRTECPIPAATRPGDTLILEWKEFYTAGEGGSHTVSYATVAPGDYLFRVMAVSPRGEPTGDAAALPLAIPQVFTRTPWFFALVLATCAGSTAAAVRVVTRRRMQRKLERLEQQQALERERARIAHDIHDDLGASLTRISLLSELMREDPGLAPRAAAHLDQIFSTAQEITRAMDEIVWAVDPRHDTLDSVANYIGRFAQEFLSAAAVRCRLELPVQLPDHRLSAEVRHNLFLAFKEALNNVVRHARAQEVRIALELDARGFVLSVEDDGRGFAVPGPAQPGGLGAVRPAFGGHGLGSMKERMSHRAGRCNCAAPRAMEPGCGLWCR
jgi:signal transduction histidine kinase